ncbi:hypothetical protein EV06_1942 [Prochlorococcus sp. MIT 0602]|nr:hypothetical protein EV06_1942 [Prochlorococcus sp. MIT 0602]KGG15689.1 hypothetical protein EV07_1654 [Prochlorococcus sp. MIT 0603]
MCCWFHCWVNRNLMSFSDLLLLSSWAGLLYIGAFLWRDLSIRRSAK